MYHLIYKTVNSHNEKYYIGKHTTNNIDDGYVGSGKALLRAIKKYGIESFSTEILFCAFTEQDAYLVESTMVDDTVVNDENSYNMMIGGKGGSQGSRPESVKRKISLKLKGRKPTESSIKKMIENHPRGEQHHYYNKTRSSDTKQKISDALTGKTRSVESRIKQSETMSVENHFKGKKHSDETIKKMKNSLRKFSFTILTPEGCELTIGSLNEFCVTHGISSCQLRTTGKAKGYTLLNKIPFSRVD